MAQYSYKLEFNTDTNAIHTITVTAGDPTATATQISDAMDAIIESNVIFGSNGELISKASASLIEVDRNLVQI